MGSLESKRTKIGFLAFWEPEGSRMHLTPDGRERKEGEHGIWEILILILESSFRGTLHLPFAHFNTKITTLSNSSNFGCKIFENLQLQSSFLSSKEQRIRVKSLSWLKNSLFLIWTCYRLTAKEEFPWRPRQIELDASINLKSAIQSQRNIWGVLCNAKMGDPLNGKSSPENVYWRSL